MAHHCNEHGRNNYFCPRLSNFLRNTVFAAKAKADTSGIPRRRFLAGVAAFRLKQWPHDADWDETRHPRGFAGTFGAGGAAQGAPLSRHEAPRLHHASRRRGGGMAARDAGATARLFRARPRPCVPARWISAIAATLAGRRASKHAPQQIVPLCDRLVSPLYTERGLLIVFRRLCTSFHGYAHPITWERVAPNEAHLAGVGPICAPSRPASLRGKLIVLQGSHVRLLSDADMILGIRLSPHVTGNAVLNHRYGGGRSLGREFWEQASNRSDEASNCHKDRS